MKYRIKTSDKVVSVTARSASKETRELLLTASKKVKAKKPIAPSIAPEDSNDFSPFVLAADRWPAKTNINTSKK